eukprot:NODE_83_length_2546_cov_204.147377_g64_i0.p1 GENE.NODE_83_length_2546_cov_204.147377_g64_i0~~NODE_83_length_2546_cov_204.147377_g64_i0.p1  ORF type:complete len:759 (-),score=122.72 NODE_83_length_2546_cov_204.147377_g64_i0:169-2445(-)
MADPGTEPQPPALHPLRPQLYVGNVPHGTDQTILFNLYRPYGALTCKLLSGNTERDVKTYAFVTFLTVQHAWEAMLATCCVSLHGRMLVVRFNDHGREEEAQSMRSILQIMLQDPETILRKAQEVTSVPNKVSPGGAVVQSESQPWVCLNCGWRNREDAMLCTRPDQLCSSPHWISRHLAGPSLGQRWLATQRPPINYCRLYVLDVKPSMDQALAEHVENAFKPKHLFIESEGSLRCLGMDFWEQDQTLAAYCGLNCVKFQGQFLWVRCHLQSDSAEVVQLRSSLQIQRSRLNGQLLRQSAVSTSLHHLIEEFEKSDGQEKVNGKPTISSTSSTSMVPPPIRALPLVLQYAAAAAAKHSQSLSLSSHRSRSRSRSRTGSPRPRRHHQRLHSSASDRRGPAGDPASSIPRPHHDHFPLSNGRKRSRRDSPPSPPPSSFPSSPSSPPYFVNKKRSSRRSEYSSRPAAVDVSRTERSRATELKKEESTATLTETSGRRSFDELQYRNRNQNHSYSEVPLKPLTPLTPLSSQPSSSPSQPQLPPPLMSSKIWECHLCNFYNWGAQESCGGQALDGSGACPGLRQPSQPPANKREVEVALPQQQQQQQQHVNFRSQTAPKEEPLQAFPSYLTTVGPSYSTHGGLDRPMPLAGSIWCPPPEFCTLPINSRPVPAWPPMPRRLLGALESRTTTTTTTATATEPQQLVAPPLIQVDDSDVSAFPPKLQQLFGIIKDHLAPAPFARYVTFQRNSCTEHLMHCLCWKR